VVQSIDALVGLDSVDGLTLMYMDTIITKLFSNWSFILANNQKLTVLKLE